MTRKPKGEVEILEPNRNERPKSGNGFGREEFAQLVALERDRVEASNRRTAVMDKMIASQNQQNQLEYEFNCKELEHAEKELSVREGQDKRRFSFAKTVFWVTSSIFVLFVGIFIFMLFFGGVEQSAKAEQILKIILIASGGAGIIFGVSKFLEKLFQRIEL